MRNIYCSTGALIGRPNKRDYRLLEKFAPELDCDGFELLVYDTWYPEVDELIETVKGFDLSIPVVHCEKSLSEKLSGARAWYDDAGYHYEEMSPEEDEESVKAAIKEFEINLKIAKGLGADKMVFHLWNGIVSDKNIERNAERFGIFKEMAEEAGILLMVENVICNEHDPMYDMDVVYKLFPDVSFVYDTKMAEFHGQTMKVFEPEWDWMFKEEHIKHLHLNDYGGGIKDWSNLKVLPIGKGHVDFGSFFVQLCKYGYDGDCTVESTAFDKTGKVDIDMLNRCFKRIREA
jgi:sugar phosphate isomerase/epimerase